MRSFFNMDGPVFVFLSKAADLMILNILFILCCIPVITIGASFTAMSYVTLKMKEGAEGYIWKSFLHAFKQNFRQATVIWLILLLIGAVLGVDLWILIQNHQGPMQIMLYVVIAGCVLWLVEVMYVFPVLARFYNTIPETIKNGMLLAFANAPKTILMLVITGGVVFITLWNTMTIVWGLLIWLICGFSLLSLINSGFQLPLFHKISPPEETEGNPDEWVVPEENEGQEANAGPDSNSNPNARPEPNLGQDPNMDSNPNPNPISDDADHR